MAEPAESKKIYIEVSIWEAAVIKKLRRYSHGELTVHILGGKPQRVVWGGSELLREEDGLDLEADPAGAGLSNQAGKTV